MAIMDNNFAVSKHSVGSAYTKDILIKIALEVPTLKHALEEFIC